MAQTIKSISGDFYQCKTQYSMIDEQGNDKRIKADYIVEASCCGEAETTLLTHLIPFYGDAEINQVTKGKIKEILYGEKEDAENYYETTLQLITLDEKSGKEKKTTIKYLVCADTMMAALKGVQDFMSKSVVDYNSIQIKQTKIVEVVKPEKK